MSSFEFRRAVAADLPNLVALLADDALGKKREILSDPIADCYTEAFRAIDEDPNQLLVVVTEKATVVGCMQLSYIPDFHVAVCGADKLRACESHLAIAALAWATG